MMTATATPKDDGEQPASVHHGYQGLLRRAGPKNEETDRDDRVNRVVQIARQVTKSVKTNGTANPTSNPAPNHIRWRRGATGWVSGRLICRAVTLAVFRRSSTYGNGRSTWMPATYDLNEQRLSDEGLSIFRLSPGARNDEQPAITSAGKEFSRGARAPRQD
jgi:hypothetical protein